MPCNSSHMEPDHLEERSRNLSQMIVWLSGKLQKPVKEGIRASAKSAYGNRGACDELAQTLCSLCNLAPEEVIYNGRDKDARRLADWWDEHQEADRAREEQERVESELQKLRFTALSKLTDEEKVALGLS